MIPGHNIIGKQEKSMVGGRREFKRGASPSFINRFPFPLLRGRGYRG